MSRLQRMNDALLSELKPDSLIIDDESHGHSVPKGAESHFKITAVASSFNNLSRVARHRLVNSIVSNEFDTGLHALSLFLYTPDEWMKKTNPIPASPKCRGGQKND